jgi:cell fate regulator YaaT (PSP1 superfamily)
MKEDGISSKGESTAEHTAADNSNAQADADSTSHSEKTVSLNAEMVYKVKIIHSSATEFCICPDGMSVDRGDYFIIPTRYGKDLGRVLGKIHNLLEVGTSEILKLEKRVSDSELKQFEKDKEKDKKAFEICKQKIKEHGLDMKLVSAHHLFGEPKILFFFTAESRVDFRDLVKDLVSVFRIRIELRQIGVRDESRVIGGIGVCGRGYCCHALTDRLNPVSIKMAKKQNLSLNSLKISGPCGRLLCCLSYEYAYYKEMKDKLPSEGTKVQLNGERCKVVEINILSRYVKLSGEDGRLVELPFDRLHFDDRENRWIAK